MGNDSLILFTTHVLLTSRSSFFWICRGRKSCDSSFVNMQINRGLLVLPPSVSNWLFGSTCCMRFEMLFGSILFGSRLGKGGWCFLSEEGI